MQAGLHEIAVRNGIMRKFSPIVKMTVFALGSAIFALAPTAQAKSEYGHHKQSRHNSYYNYGYNYNWRDHHRSYNRHYNHNRHSYSWRHYYGGRYYSRHHGGHGNEVVLGLFLGGLFFSALTANERHRYNDRTVYVRQQPVYTQPIQQKWTQQPVIQPRNSSCLQVREYQTTITVGNRSVPAYGQSCLQADGSWKLGPAIPEPGY